MRINTRTRELSLSQDALCIPKEKLEYKDGWLTSGAITPTAQCIIILAHDAGYIIYDSHSADITDHVESERCLLAAQQRAVYGTSDPV